MGSNFAALNAGNIDTIIVIKIEQSEIINIELIFISDGILLKKIGLSSRSDHLPSELSGGEAQRISIARAIINDPKIILADEPTGSLDTSNAKNIFQLLKDQKRPDRLIIFATHNRFFANKADYLLEIKDGSIKTTNV